MEKDLISLIIPVYNVEKHLARCVDSVLCQTYSNLEIILVDDGSLDTSGAICDEYAKKDKRVVVVHRENGGLSRARNSGIDIMKGEWLTFIDSDDYISMDYIKTLYELCVKNDSDISCCSFERTSLDTLEFEKLNNRGTIKEKNFTGREAMLNLQGKGQCMVSIIACTKLYSASTFEKYRFKEGIIHEDEELVWRLLYNARKVSATSKIMYGYYMSKNSIMRSNFNKDNKIIFSILQERLSFYKERDEQELYELTLKSKCYALQDYYCKCKEAFPQETELYTNMRQEFLKTYPQTIKSKYIPLKSKLCLLTMRISPKLYRKLRG